jgi:hypothetical protein
VIKIEKKYLNYLEKELQVDTIALGTPIYKSVNACLLASFIGYKENYRSAYRTKENKYLFFVCGKKIFESCQ